MYPIIANNIVNSLEVDNYLFMAMLLMYQLMSVQFKNSAKTYKWTTNHSYKIEKQAKLEVPIISFTMLDQEKFWKQQKIL